MSTIVREINDFLVPNPEGLTPTLASSSLRSYLAGKDIAGIPSEWKIGDSDSLALVLINREGEVTFNKVRITTDAPPDRR